MSREGGYMQIETKTTYTKSEDDSFEIIVNQYVVKKRLLAPESSDTSRLDRAIVGNTDTYKT